jgi:hypothetical protein
MANNGLLELNSLNSAMNLQGVFVGCTLRFYTQVLVYAVGFGAGGAFNIERYNRFLGYWEQLQFSGTIRQTINTLNMVGPFITAAQIDQLWGGLGLPPEPPIEGPFFDPV